MFEQLQKLGMIFAIRLIDAGKAFIADTGGRPLGAATIACIANGWAERAIASDTASDQLAIGIDLFENDDACRWRCVCLGPGPFAYALQRAVILKVFQDLTQCLALTTFNLQPTRNFLLRSG